jgi:hypothetical protein
MAQLLLDGIVAGTIVIDEEGSIDVSSPAFWPDDTTGSSQQYDGAGFPLGDTYSEDRKFSMGRVF